MRAPNGSHASRSGGRNSRSPAQNSGSSLRSTVIGTSGEPAWSGAAHGTPIAPRATRRYRPHVAELPYRLVDADNHYYEPDDCFTRHLDPAFASRAYRIRRDAAG